MMYIDIYKKNQYVKPKMKTLTLYTPDTCIYIYI